MSRQPPQQPVPVVIPPENLVTVEVRRLRDLPPKKGRDKQARLYRRRKYRALRKKDVPRSNPEMGNVGKQSQAWGGSLKRELESLLESLLELANVTPPDELAQLLGDLERIRVTVFARLTTPRTAEKDERLSVKQAALKLHVSTNYVYRHHGEFSFTRREGRKLLFSSLGIDAHMKKCA